MFILSVSFCPLPYHPPPLCDITPRPTQPPSEEADDQLDDGQRTVDMSEAEEPWLTEEEIKEYSIGGL